MGCVCRRFSFRRRPTFDVAMHRDTIDADRRVRGGGMNIECLRDDHTPEALANASIIERGTRLIGGVTLPDNPLITSVIAYTQRLSEPYLFYHVMRSWFSTASQMVSPWQSVGS